MAFTEGDANTILKIIIYDTFPNILQTCNTKSSIFDILNKNQVLLREISSFRREKMRRKMKMQGKKYGFKGGNIPLNKGKKCNYEPQEDPLPFMRLPHTVFESRVVQNNENVLEIHDTDQSVCTPMLLRPRPKSPELVDEYLDPVVSDPDNHTYKHYVPCLVSKLWNATIKEHIIASNACDGDLEFDSHAAQKWGYAWKERLKCVKCGFKGQFYKLYYEVYTARPGRRAATLNMALQAGLQTQPISNKGFRDISITCNIIPANLSGMQKLANRVGSVIVQYNHEDKQDIREWVVAENEMVGHSNPNYVNVESDGRYNNPIYNSDVTAFQAGTQVVQTMIENNSSNKRIISVYTGNKLCNVASRLRNKGIEVLCPNHAGYCSANLAEDDVIGNETEYAKQCTIELNDTLQVRNITTDGDSRAASGVVNAQKSSVTVLRDVRHLASGIKRAIQNCTFSTTMFQGSNKRNLKHRFGMDLKARCVAELNQAFSAHKGELFEIKKAMPATITAIIRCYSGECGMACQIHSFVCAGLSSNRWKKGFLPGENMINMSDEDEKMVANCIKTLLGPKSLDLVRFLTSTQKCEAFNRTLQRCNPKSVTHSRNFPGRVHTAVHLMNHKFANSTLLRTKVLGAELTHGSSVIKHLKQNQKVEVYVRHRKTLKESKCLRSATRQRKYDMHAAKNYKQHYRKGISDPKVACT